MADLGKRKGKTARYLTILKMVRERIASGLYTVGSSLPSEAEFCAEFDTSRFTIREACAVCRLKDWLRGGKGQDQLYCDNVRKAYFCIAISQWTT